MVAQYHKAEDAIIFCVEHCSLVALKPLQASVALCCPGVWV